MSFIAPLFALGALAVALPVIFHLIRRTTREQTVFSSLMFLLPTPPRVTRKSRLDNIFLLILRCAVIAVLALGFARPFIKKPMAAEPDGQSSTKVIVLLDSSASMRRENLWDQAVTRAESVLKRLSPSDQVAVYTFDQQPRAVMAFNQWAAASPGDRIGQAVKRLSEVKPTWGSTALGNALTAVAEAFEDADKKDHLAGVRRIVLITDLQEGSRLEGLQGFEWPVGSEVVVETVSAKRPTNAGLQLMSISEDAAATESGGVLRARLSSASDSAREQFTVRWGAGTNRIEVYVPPGQTRTIPVPENLAGGSRLTVEGDEADFDNVIHLIPPKADELKILFLGEDSDRDSKQGLFYLTRALQDTHRQKIRVLAKTAADPLTAADLAGVQLIVVSDVLTEARVAAVRQLLNQGRTVLLTMKTPAAAGTIGKLVNVPALVAEEAEVGNYAMIGQIEFQHPLFAPFADPRFSDFTKIHFWKHRRMNAEMIPKAKVLARFDNSRSDPAVVEIPVGSGTVYALTFGWFPTDSQLALSTKFIPLLYSILDQSGAVRAQTSQYLIGDAVDLSAARATQALTIRKPDGTEVKAEVGERFAQTDTPGIYSVAGARPAMQFAVNLRPEESKTAPMPMETLEKLGVPLKVFASETPKQAALAEKKKRDLQSTELENRQKLWRWLIVAALVILMFETWLAGRLTRRAAAVTEATA